MDRGSAQRHASAGCGGRAAWVVVSGGGLDAVEADGSCPVAPERRGRGRRREDGDADGGRWRRGRGRSREKRWRDAAAVFAGGDSRARPGRLLPRRRSGPGKMVALARQWNDRTTVAPPDCFTECFHKMIQIHQRNGSSTLQEWNHLAASRSYLQLQLGDLHREPHPDHQPPAIVVLSC